MTKRQRNTLAKHASTRLDAPKVLHKAHNHVAGINQRTLLAQTYARAAVEWQVSPSRPQRRSVFTINTASLNATTASVKPARRPERLSVGAVDGRQPMHGPYRVVHGGAFGDEDGREAVWATTARNRRVALGEAHVDGDGRMEAQS